MALPDSKWPLPPHPESNRLSILHPILYPFCGGASIILAIAFIKSRQARDEMGKLHWRLNNHFQHYGGAGFHALGFDPSKDLRQGLLTFMFDDNAMKRSEAAVLEQLPRMIHAANRDGAGLLVEELFAGNCNDTPVTSEIMGRQLILLRDEGELAIVTPDGTRKPRAKNVGWEDHLILPSERSLFSRLGW